MIQYLKAEEEKRRVGFFFDGVFYVCVFFLYPQEDCTVGLSFSQQTVFHFDTMGSSSPLAFIVLILALMLSSIACRQRWA